MNYLIFISAYTSVEQTRRERQRTMPLKSIWCMLLNGMIPTSFHIQTFRERFISLRMSSPLLKKQNAGSQVFIVFFFFFFFFFFFCFSFTSLSSFFTHIETNQSIGGAKTGVPGEKPPDTPASRTWLVPHVTRAPTHSSEMIE